MIFVYWLPTLIESWLDRKGETKKGKRKDFWWSVVAAIIITGLAWLWFGKNPLMSVLMILMFRFTTFDYITHALLKRYSGNHGHINIWTYTGKSTHWHDQLAAKVPWKIRLISRVLVLVAAVWWYCTS